MTDIITQAKRLLEHATPGPWYPHDDDWDGEMVVNDAGREMSWHGEQLRVIIQAGNPAPDSELIAAAPELAKTVAEETYLYGVQVWVDAQWIMMLTSNYGISLMHRGRWFVHKHEAEDFAEMWSRATPTRIVRRRVSPVEVME